jgi:hypothetical protein
MYNDKLANGGRSIKWAGLLPTEAQLQKIEKAIKKYYKDANVYVYNTEFIGRRWTDGLRVRVTF